MEHLSEKKYHTCCHKGCLRFDCKGSCVWIKSLKYKSISQSLVYHLNDWLMVMTDDCCALMPEALSGLKTVFCLLDKKKVLQSIGWVQWEHLRPFHCLCFVFCHGTKWSLCFTLPLTLHWGRRQHLCVCSNMLLWNQLNSNSLRKQLHWDNQSHQRHPLRP